MTVTLTKAQAEHEEPDYITKTEDEIRFHELAALMTDHPAEDYPGQYPIQETR